MQIKPPKNSRKKKHRVARGESSGWGCSAGRGIKGQKSRAGGGAYTGHEGGQLPFYRKLPKAKGFAAYIIPRLCTETISLDKISKNFDKQASVSIADLKQKKLIGSRAVGVKVLLRGKIEHPIHLKGLSASKAALKAIEAAGGSIQ